MTHFYSLSLLPKKIEHHLERHYEINSNKNYFLQYIHVSDEFYTDRFSHCLGISESTSLKNFLLDEKIFFGTGASIASFIFFFLLGYMSTYFSKYAQNDKIWKFINIFIIAFMLLLTIYIIKETVYLI